MRSGLDERTSLCTQKPTSSYSAGQSRRRPLLRGVHDEPPSSVSNAPTPCTMAKKLSELPGSVTKPEMPRCPGGWFAGSSHSSLPCWPERVDRSDQVWPLSRLSKMPGASTPTSRRSPARASVETLEILRPSSSPYERPSLDISHVSPRSALRQIDEPCHSLAAAA